MPLHNPGVRKAKPGDIRRFKYGVYDNIGIIISCDDFYYDYRIVTIHGEDDTVGYASEVSTVKISEKNRKLLKTIYNCYLLFEEYKKVLDRQSALAVQKEGSEARLKLYMHNGRDPYAYYDSDDAFDGYDD